MMWIKWRQWLAQASDRRFQTAPHNSRSSIFSRLFARLGEDHGSARRFWAHIKITFALSLLLLVGSSLSAQADPQTQLMLPLILAGGNMTPVATDDEYQVIESTPRAVNAAKGVLANDSDPELWLMQVVPVSGVSNGVLNLRSNGSFNYTPEAGFTGQDSFTYQANNGWATSNLATVTLTVILANKPPQIVTGEIAFTKKIIGTGVQRSHSVMAADLDGDDDLDVVATHYGEEIGGIGGNVPWFENDGRGDFVKKVVDPDLQGAYPSHVADVDGDGVTDVLAGGYDADTFVWYRNNGAGSFTRKDIDTAADGAHSIVTVDMDGDDDIDLLTSSQDSEIIAWYENDGANNFTQRIIERWVTMAKRAEAADLDNDGDLDVIAASFIHDRITWHENDGDQNFTMRTIYSEADGAYYVSAADIDGDGNIDVLSASQEDNKIAWFKNDGAGGFAVRIIDTNALGARTVISEDVDRDGDADVLSASVNDNTVAWYENNGSGDFTKRVVDSSVLGAYSVFAIDMDYDSDIDLLSTSRDAGEIVLHTHIRAHSASIDSGGTLVIDSTRLLTIDADDSAADLTYTITGAPNSGQIRVNGVPAPEGATFTQLDINNKNLTYVHNGLDKSPDGFSFTVADGGTGGIQPAGGTFSISIR